MTIKKKLTLINAIHEANAKGLLPREFRAKDIKKTCPGWAEHTYSSALSNYCDSKQTHFNRVSRGLYTIKHN